MGDDVDRYSVCDREGDPYMERCGLKYQTHQSSSGGLVR